ncbi:hypothetical protein [Fusibacter sp. 3D3]|uniref:hypothetical protein n=1 Tax=Fusibacter sp. 3D3 TaxID=1048380 RepID=UPI000853BA21|nr:hypothetical protein [Fusibacter sp. 3D3]GAU77871.1 hypothetical protein F3D3_2500 [Fusibacter sp. 3D3]
MKLVLEPIPVTEEILLNLENRGIINRICPGHDPLSVQLGESKFDTVYQTDAKWGPHKLICVTINKAEPVNFLFHSDREDFMLIDFEDTAPLVLTMCLHSKDILNDKIQSGTLSEQDFISIICAKNHLFFSFFTMNPYFAHVETCLSESDKPPSFYVSEPRDLDENLIDLGKYTLEINRH